MATAKKKKKAKQSETPYILVHEAKGYKLYKYASTKLKAFIIKNGEHAFRGSTVEAYKAFFELTGVTLHR